MLTAYKDLHSFFSLERIGGWELGGQDFSYQHHKASDF